MNSDEAAWVGVEAMRLGFPVLMRFRRIAPQPGFGKLFVITWSYSEDNPKRLPPPEFYSKLERFEQVAIEEIERDGLGIFVASETGLGKTRYYFYTRSTEPLAAALDKWIAASESVEFASDDDEEWDQYSKWKQLL
jgi:hypothetical protein